MRMPTLDEINFMASLASIAGLAVTAITYYRVSNLRKEVAGQSINKTIYSLLDEIEKIPITKTDLTDKQMNSVEEAIIYIEAFFVGRFPWSHRNRKALIAKIKNEKNRNPNLSAENLKRDFRLLKDDIFTVNGK